MAEYRDELVVIAAGYPGPMHDFLTTHAGLAAQFPTTMTFASYTPEEIVTIGRHLASKEHLIVEGAAWELLGAEAARLQSIPYGNGTLLDAFGNAHYARDVTAACRRARIRRLHRLAPRPRDLEQLLRTNSHILHISAGDMKHAIAAAHPAIAVAI
ncbi:hypothetical protein [Mycobacterium heidelbergense]|nr:hypothetical protein [Mycobacterium heidelbergense]